MCYHTSPRNRTSLDWRSALGSNTMAPNRQRACRESPVSSAKLVMSFLLRNAAPAPQFDGWEQRRLVRYKQTFFRTPITVTAFSPRFKPRTLRLLRRSGWPASKYVPYIDQFQRANCRSRGQRSFDMCWFYCFATSPSNR